MKQIRCFGVIACLALLAAILSCSSNDDASVTGNPRADNLLKYENPIAGRANPLQAFIRTHWTASDPNKTGGLHYDHIKLFAANYRNFQTYVPNWSDQVQFVINHYDMYMWGGPIVGQSADPDDFLWLQQVVNVPSMIWSPTLETWLADPSNNPNGYTFDDLTLHYKYNVQYSSDCGLIQIPGWNPADDIDGDGCIDGSPSDPNRTALCYEDSRVRRRCYAGLENWYMSLFDEPYFWFWTQKTIEAYNQYQVKGYHLDEVAYQCESVSLDKTFTYEGMNECAADYPYITDRYAAVPEITHRVESAIGPLAVMLANTGSPLYICGTQKDVAHSYIENHFNEFWMQMNYSQQSAAFNTSYIDSWLNCPYLFFLGENKGIVFSAHDQTHEDGWETGSDQGRGFSLATFYMINHQMAFYYYRAMDHRVESNDPPVWIGHWNPLVEFSVGQPHTNALGLPDFDGQMNTDRYFIWKQLNDPNVGYKILGREFQRTDGSRVLVLSKVMQASTYNPASPNPTTHTLPLKWWRLVQETDGSLGWVGPLTQITLNNNEGAILLKYVKDQDPPDPYQEP